jgi:hypothetical protein
VRKTAAAVLVVAAVTAAAAIDDRRALAERVTRLTRESSWTLVASVPMAFRTFHPQGMVRIGDTFFISSVEVRNREAGEGVGHLFKVDRSGKLIEDLRLGEGSVYHPGGMDYDGKDLWVPVAEYRPDSRSIIYRVRPDTLRATPAFRVDDHIGAIVHDTDADTLHGVSWGSRRFYRWTSNGERVRIAINPSHYIDYQDCKYAALHRMVCTGVTELRQGKNRTPPFRLGGIDLLDLADGRPIHQVPLLLWTPSGLDMTHNPVWLEATGTGLRGYFMPEDDASTVFVYETETR